MDLYPPVELNITQNSYKEPTHRLKCGRQEHLNVLSSSWILWSFSVGYWRKHSVLSTLLVYISWLPHAQVMREERETSKFKKKKQVNISLLGSRLSSKLLAFQMLPNHSNWQMARTADGWAQLRHRYSCE